MSVRVNLLPREAEEREAQRRGYVILGVIAVVLLVVLALGYFWQVGRVSDKEDELAAEQEELTALQAELRELSEFRDLETRLEGANTLIAGSLGGEVSFAGILQDLAAIMPNDAELTTLSLAAQPAGPGARVPGTSYGTLTTSGRVLNSHAPGVERLLLEFDKVAAFFDVFIGSSTIDEGGIASFSLDLQLGPEIFTGRYDQGIPEGLR